MCRSIAAALVSLLATSTASAQVQPPQPTTPVDPTSPQLSKADFLLRLQRLRGNEWVYMTDTESKYFFNRARCECETPFKLQVDVTPSGRPKLASYRSNTARFRVRVGSPECVSAQSDVQKTAACRDFPAGEEGKETPTFSLSDLVRQGVEAEFTVRQLFFSNMKDAEGKVASLPCDRDTKQQMWVWIDTDNNGFPDLSGDLAPSIGLNLEGAGPEPPDPLNIEVKSGHEALEVKWKALESAIDFDGYLVFCARAGTHQVFNPSPFKEEYYQTALSVCPERFGGAPMPLTLAQTADGTDKGSRVPSPGPFTTLDPNFLCAERITSQTGVRLKTLQNGVPYVVGVTTVDKHGNASPIAVSFLQTPIPTLDFYSGYRGDGGSARGGFCAVAPRTRGGARPGWLGFGLAAALGALFVRAGRRAARRRGRGAGAPGGDS